MTFFEISDKELQGDHLKINSVLSLPRGVICSEFEVMALAATATVTTTTTTTMMTTTMMMMHGQMNKQGCRAAGRRTASAITYTPDGHLKMFLLQFADVCLQKFNPNIY